MLAIERIVTRLFDANCYVIADEESGDALIVDPGVGAAMEVAQRVAARGWTPRAVLLTHGHPDHTWDAAAVAGDSLPVYLPAPDLEWLVDPLSRLRMSAALPVGAKWRAPVLVEEVPLQSWEPVPGVMLRMIPAPGHSAGSALFLLAGSRVGPDDPGAPLALSGDVIFAGSVGRTDLWGSDDQVMQQSLRTLVSALDPRTVLLPGHGEETIWEREIATNAYVRRAAGLGGSRRP